MGEPAGIGGEMLLKAWMGRATAPVFFAIDDAGRLADLARRLGWAVPVARVTAPEQAAHAFQTALPVLDQPLAEPAVPGRPNPAHAAAIIGAIEQAVALAQAGRVSAVMTNPIHKHSLYDAGFRFPGHTEFLADLAGGGAQPVMLLAAPALKTVPVTVHMPLRDAVTRLSTALIVSTARVVDLDLRRRFGVARPRLAIAGLNPHAGEGGSLGMEDRAVIIPAIDRLRDAGIAATGPHPADTLFHDRARAGYDVALCMYHDQALIPIKTLAFDQAVNVTLGLPFIRTSPDHGTAFDIAGTGQARADSTIAALALAGDLAGRAQAAGP